jgi:uncharacterized protein YjiS (DUF1127 family)
MLSLPHLSRLFAALIAAHDLHRQRARLRLLDDHALADIGLTRAEAEAEASRAVWNAPRHWQSAAPAPLRGNPTALTSDC